MFKKLFFLLVGLIGSVYCSGDTKAFNGNVELITSRYTELYLVQSNESSTKKLFNSKYEPFSSLSSSNLSFYQSYQLGSEDVLLFLSEDNSENCTKFVIVSVQKNAEAVVTPLFGNCSDSPEITLNSNSIELNFPLTSTAISQTVVYKDQKIEVTERKLSKK